MALQNDTSQQLILDRSAADFSSAANYAAAVADTAAQTASLDAGVADFVDCIVDITNLGSGPITKVTIVARTSSKGEPDITSAGDWSAVNTEAVDTATGISTVVRYQAEFAITAVGRICARFPVSERFMSFVVWVDSASGSRGAIYGYRRRGTQ